MTALHIAEPCRASWDSMTPNQMGRHCADCDKTVIDVTALAPEAVRAYLHQELPNRVARGERICVRAHTDRAGRLHRPGLSRRLLTNGLALMLAAATGLAGFNAELTGAEQTNPPIDEQPVAGPVMVNMGLVACPDPLDPVSDAASGITVCVDPNAKILIATDATGAERWRVNLQEPATKLSLTNHVVTVSCGAQTVSVDIRTGGRLEK